MTLGIQPSWATLLTRKIVKEILNIIQFVTIIFTYFIRHQGILCFSRYKTVSGLLKQNNFPCTYLTIGWTHSLASLRTADAFPVVTGNAHFRSRPEMRLLFAGYSLASCRLGRPPTFMFLFANPLKMTWESMLSHRSSALFFYQRDHVRSQI